MANLFISWWVGRNELPTFDLSFLLFVTLALDFLGVLSNCN